MYHVVYINDLNNNSYPHVLSLPPNDVTIYCKTTVVRLAKLIVLPQNPKVLYTKLCLLSNLNCSRVIYYLNEYIYTILVMGMAKK